MVALPDHKAWAELVAVPATSVFALPSGMSYLDAAAITMNYTVAYILLFELAHLTPGKSLLLHSAGGGVVSRRENSPFTFVPFPRRSAGVYPSPCPARKIQGEKDDELDFLITPRSRILYQDSEDSIRSRSCNVCYVNCYVRLYRGAWYDLSFPSFLLIASLPPSLL